MTPPYYDLEYQEVSALAAGDFNLHSPDQMPDLTNMQRRLLASKTVLRNPPYSSMSNEDRLLHACLVALDSIVYGSDMFSEREVMDSIRDAVCETVGDETFCMWLRDRGNYQND